MLELAYEALRTGSIDVLDVYTTDAQIERLGLVLLEDELRFFPRYDAVLLFRSHLPARAPGIWTPANILSHMTATVCLPESATSFVPALPEPTSTISEPF